MVILRTLILLFAASTMGCSFVNAPSSHTNGPDAGPEARLDAAVVADAAPPIDAHATSDTLVPPDAPVPTTDAPDLVDARSEIDTASPRPATIRVVHLARDTGRVEVFAGGVRLADRLGFSSASAPVEIPAGTVDVRVTRVGATASLVEEPIDLEPGRQYTLTFYGDEGVPPLAGRTLGLLLLDDDATGFDPSSQIKLSVIHVAVPVIAGQLVSIGPSGNMLLIDDFDFRAVAPLTLDSRGYTVGFDAGADGFVDVEFVIPTLAAGTYANVFVASRPDNSVYLFVQTSDGTTLEINAAQTRLRVAHLARDTGPVDVYANGNLIANDVAFSTVGMATDIPSESVTFRVVRADSDEELIERTFTAVLGREYTLTLYGDETAPPTFADRTLGLLFLDDDASGFDRTREIRLVPIHVAVPVIAGQLVAIRPPAEGNLLLVDEFGFRATATLTLAAMPYRVGFDAGADGLVDLFFDIPGSLVPGTYANVFVAARPDDSVYLLVSTSRGGTVVIDPS